MIGLCVGCPAEDPGLKARLPKKAVCFDGACGTCLRECPWNSRVGNWTDLAADFYKPPYNHYPEVPAMLRQQGFWAGEEKD